MGCILRFLEDGSYDLFHEEDVLLGFLVSRFDEAEVPFSFATWTVVGTCLYLERHS